jgi:hypothetical protein
LTWADVSFLAARVAQTVSELNWARAPQSKDDLTPLQQEVLMEAYDGTTLAELVNWCASAEDGAFWNRKWKYVPELIAASVVLFNAGMIDVLDGEIILSKEIAMGVLTDPNNWWSFAPEDHSDPDEWERLKHAGAATGTSVDRYRLDVTEYANIPWPGDQIGAE